MTGVPRLLKLVLATLVGAALALVSALWFFQDRLIYPAPRYAPTELKGLPVGLTALRDPREPESIVGFYRPPMDGAALRKLWLTFGGNGDAALRWDPLLAASATAGTGILMIEYPGYGARAGEPSPESLLAGSEASVRALAALLDSSINELEQKTSLLGYSIGSAVALRYAVKHPPERIVLVAPFTSMLEMARRSVGSPLCHLLSHRYDNVASLRAIQARGQPPLTILHGQNDGFIPSSMGAELAALAPGSRFELVPGADHGDVVDLAQERLRSLLRE
jgi:pimeloyl-ACP methyl ester carboxylesterase